MNCRENCGACCIAISISSPMPGYPYGKPASIKCPFLTKEYKCDIFHHPERPKTCKDFKPELIICGNSQQEAMDNLSTLENSCR